MSKVFTARLKLKKCCLTLLLFVGGCYKPPLWQKEVDTLLHKNIPIGTSQRQTEKWLFSRKMGSETNGLTTTAYIGKHHFNNRDEIWMDSIKVELYFDQQKKLTGWGRMVETQRASL